MEGRITFSVKTSPNELKDYMKMKTCQKGSLQYAFKTTINVFNTISNVIHFYTTNRFFFDTKFEMTFIFPTKPNYITTKLGFELKKIYWLIRSSSHSHNVWVQSQRFMAFLFNFFFSEKQVSLYSFKTLFNMLFFLKNLKVIGKIG